LADTAKRLAGPTALGTTATTVYTVPGSTVTILRGIHVANTTAGALGFTASIGSDAAGTRLWSAQSVPANGSLDWSGFQVMSTADVLQAYGSATGLTLTVSGVESA
jgi:hypothetical protein